MIPYTHITTLATRSIPYIIPPRTSSRRPTMTTTVKYSLEEFVHDMSALVDEQPDHDGRERHERCCRDDDGAAARKGPDRDGRANRNGEQRSDDSGGEAHAHGKRHDHDEIRIPFRDQAPGFREYLHSPKRPVSRDWNCGVPTYTSRGRWQGRRGPSAKTTMSDGRTAPPPSEISHARVRDDSASAPCGRFPGPT